MKKNILNWFDRLMIDVTYAEAGVEKPDLSTLGEDEPRTRREEDAKNRYETITGDPVPAR